MLSGPLHMAQVSPAFWSIALFRWDINLRESAVLGLVVSFATHRVVWGWPIEAFIVESHDPEGPLGAKEAGEGPLHR